MDISELVHPFFPGTTREECWHLLWNATCFPAMGTDNEGIEYYKSQLKDISEKSGQDISKVDKIVWDEMDAAIESGNKRECDGICRF